MNEENKENVKQKSFTDFIDKISKLPLPVTIIISVFILGTFYYAAEVKKIKYQEDKENRVKQEKMLKDFESNNIKKLCASDAEDQAVKNYKRNCEDINKITYTQNEDCDRGLYNIENYNNLYNKCLDSHGIEK